MKVYNKLPITTSSYTFQYLHNASVTSFSCYHNNYHVWITGHDLKIAGVAITYLQHLFTLPGCPLFRLPSRISSALQWQVKLRVILKSA